METGKRQRSVFEPKVHSVGEGGGAEILQQAGCKCYGEAELTDI